MHYYQKAAARGNAAAINNIGLLYQEGLGVEQDFKKAVGNYAIAAEMGSNLALCNLGMIHLSLFSLSYICSFPIAKVFCEMFEVLTLLKVMPVEMEKELNKTI